MEQIERIRTWLTKHAMPLWSQRGVDWEEGGFVENLSTTGERLDGPKRTMVQARQIYAFRIAADLGFLRQAEASKAIQHSADFLTKYAFLPSGASAHSVDRRGSILVETPDLYAQAFVVFGMANAYRMSPRPEYREKAMALVRYLHRERRNPNGGYTEVKDGGVQYQSNPHMHLFEAALSWLEIDSDPLWKKLADELFELCASRFIDAGTGLLAEHFDESWDPIRTNGHFVFEPGHQYEWSWLMSGYERLTGNSTRGLSQKLFQTSEEHGIFRSRGYVYDEVWSDFTPKKKSSRFWPQTERIKAAMRQNAPQAGDDAMNVLFKYLEYPVPGLWNDTWMESGEFTGQPVKASSLYHIIGAMNEYLMVRPKL